MPMEVSKRYEQYCKITKMKLSEPLRVLIMESIPQIHHAENLDKIVSRARNWKEHGKEVKEFCVRLPDEAIQEIHTYCSFFKIKRCHFLYYLIEEKLLKAMDNVLEKRTAEKWAE